MFHFRRLTLFWAFAGVSLAGCSGSAGTVTPQPTGSAAPPIVAARGTLAVNQVMDGQNLISIVPPHRNQIVRQLPIEGPQFHVTSLAFDQRNHLYAGYNDTSKGGRYLVQELDLGTWTNVRLINLPQWHYSSVATDDQNNLYVNTKALLGGDVKIFRNNSETKPYLEIKDPAVPRAILVGHQALWVAYNPLSADDLLARYPLRSTRQTWLQRVHGHSVRALAVNSEGTLVAALLRGRTGVAINVIDVGSGKLVRTILQSDGLAEMTSGQSGRFYALERRTQADEIYSCDFQECTAILRVSDTSALAVNPLDGTLYVAGRRDIGVYDPHTRKRVTTIRLPNGLPTVLAFEP